MFNIVVLQSRFFKILAEKIYNMFSELYQYIESIIIEFNQISSNRQNELNKLTQFIQSQLETEEKALLNFICTHNSRRSHFGQVWAAVAAVYFQIPNVQTFSGGTEATACNIRSVAALRRAGLEVNLEEKMPKSQNPLYQVSFSKTIPPMLCFSKVYDDVFNPSNGFAAIMTCDHADENCPVVLGALQRFAITYQDPKAADGTPQEKKKYDERCRQIAREMFYTFSKVGGRVL